jgi:hypothetical protein
VGKVGHVIAPRLPPILICACAILGNGRVVAERCAVLDPGAFAHYIEAFNWMDDERVTNWISNADSWRWLRQEVPFFQCPDREVEETYYFRWWSFRKHLKQTPDGFVLTEFIVPRPHAGIHNTISCAVGHHLAEGRWLRNGRYLDEYIRFWFRGREGQPQPHFHAFSSWIAAAVLDRHLVQPDTGFLTDLLHDLVADYNRWEAERRLPNGLFWQYDVRDGMEESISGSREQRQARPTINSYMFASARAIAAIARMAGQPELTRDFNQRAARIKDLTQSLLWDDAAKFFKVRREDGTLAGVREAIGFIPWCFGLPDQGYEAAWARLMDPGGFRAPFGMTTAERRHPEFRSHGCCGCEWDGPVWPFATSQTLIALANVVRNYPQSVVTSRDYFDAFLTYARCHRFEGQPYIGEYLDEVTGHWLKGRQERSRFYNHSTFADLLITGVVGLQPRADEAVEVFPLLPADMWSWFCLDGISYHGVSLTILWDADGSRYGRGAGLSLLADGRRIAHSPALLRITGELPE